MSLLWLAKNWKLVVAGSLTVAVLLIWAYASHLRHIAQAQKAQLQQSAKTLQVQTAATEAVDHVVTKTQAVEERSHEAVRIIQKAPGANDPVPPGVLAGWLSGLSDDTDQPPH